MTQNLHSHTESSFGIVLISAVLFGVEKGYLCFGTWLLSKLARLARQSQELSCLLSISSLLGCLLSWHFVLRIRLFIRLTYSEVKKKKTLFKISSLRLQDFICSVLAATCRCGVLVGLRLVWKVRLEVCWIHVQCNLENMKPALN